MLSYQAIAVLHCGHRDPGRTMDSRLGRRWMQTFKKLPMTAPTSTATITDHCGLILPPPRASRTRRVRAPIVRELPEGDKATDRSLTPLLFTAITWLRSEERRVGNECIVEMVTSA